MGWIADLLKEIPSSATLVAKLEEAQAKYDKLEGELARCKEQNAWLKGELEKYTRKDLGDIETQMLILISNSSGRQLAEHVGPQFNMSTSKAEHYLITLERSGYLVSVVNLMGGPKRYGVSDRGREYLVRNDLIK